MLLFYGDITTIVSSLPGSCYDLTILASRVRTVLLKLNNASTQTFIHCSQGWRFRHFITIHCDILRYSKYYRWYSVDQVEEYRVARAVTTSICCSPSQPVSVDISIYRAIAFINQYIIEGDHYSTCAII